jgi:hypothetical protein
MEAEMNTYDAPRGPWLVGSEFADRDPRMEVTIAFERDAVPVRTLRYRREAIEAAISAAPDLLAACEALLARLAVKERQLGGHRVGRMPESVFAALDKTAGAEDQARAAIAKARPAPSTNGDR